jgi:hypothetical protein
MLRRAATIGADVFGGAAIILCIPLAILAIGIPIALVFRMLLWVVDAL